MRSIVASVAFLLGLVGCATTPTFEPYKGQNAACLKGDTANIIRFFSEGEAHVFIKEIDGVPTKNGRQLCFTPGKHTIGVSATNNYQTAQDYVELDFESNRQYWLRANLRGISFLFQFIDVTRTPQVKLGEFSIKVSSTATPVFIPVIVP